MSTSRFSRFPMKKGEVFKLTQPRGCIVRAEKGRLWITQTHQSTDYLVEGGGTFVAHGNELVVVEALAATLVSVTHVQPAATAATCTGAVLAPALQGA